MIVVGSGRAVLPVEHCASRREHDPHPRVVACSLLFTFSRNSQYWSVIVFGVSVVNNFVVPPRIREDSADSGCTSWWLALLQPDWGDSAHVTIIPQRRHLLVAAEGWLQPVYD